jgi:transcription elongation factor GreA
MSESPVYLTPDGLAKLTEELEVLKTSRRRETIVRVERARELGDLRENADYQDAKEELGWIEGRILELTDMIRRAVTVGEDRRTDIVTLGCTVLVRRDGGEKSFRIVGAAEADPLAGRISNESPLGLVLIGRRLGEKAEINVPSGRVTYEIVEIK